MNICSENKHGEIMYEGEYCLACIIIENLQHQLEISKNRETSLEISLETYRKEINELREYIRNLEKKLTFKRKGAI